MFKAELVKFLAGKLKQKEEVLAALIEVPPDFGMGNYALPCFFLAKERKQPPQQIAAHVAQELAEQQPAFIDRIEAVGPYVNFFIHTEIFAKTLITEILDEKDDFGRKKPTKKRIMVEFSQANTHKEFHVGHLRNTCLGQAIVNLLKFQGHTIIAANYPGDIGTHVAKCLWCFKKFHSNDVIPANKGKYLGQIYVEANALSEEDSAAKEEISRTLQLLEARDPEYTQLWKETRQWSLDEVQAIYDELGVHFDVWYFESEVEEAGKHIVKDLLKKKIAQESDGAIIVDLKQYDLDVMLILKSDGTSLYATKDLELAFRKFKEQKLDASTYVVDIRQSMYFRQLFKTLELYGFTKPLYHVAYDFVSTKEGPISSRKGNAYLYEDIRDAMVAKLKDETRKRHADWSDDVIMANARKLTFGALKFGMLKMERNRPIIFDEDEWLDFEGETGPYVQYSYARLNSILAKAGTLPNTANFGTLSTTVEKQLLSLLTQFPAIAEQAAAQYKPAVIARYVLDIAQKANEFYHSCPILSADEQAKNARLLLVQAIMQIMRNALFLLNIDVVQAM